MKVLSKQLLREWGKQVRKEKKPTSGNISKDHRRSCLQSLESEWILQSLSRGRGDEFPYFYTSHSLAEGPSGGQVSPQILQLSARPFEHAGRVAAVAWGKFSKKCCKCLLSEGRAHWNQAKTHRNGTEVWRHLHRVPRSALLWKIPFREMALRLYQALFLIPRRHLKSISYLDY